MKSLKTVSLLVLIFFLFLTIVSCGNSGKETTQDNTSAPKTNEVVSSEDGPLGKYAQELKITFGMPVSAEDVAKMEETIGENLDTFRMKQQIKEQLNISIEYTLIAPYDQYPEKLKLAMSSNNLPDAFRINNYSDLKNLVEADKVWDMTEIYDKYAMPELKEYLTDEGERAFDPVRFNGKIYGIPAKMPSTNLYNGLWIRKDWLDKLGLQPPKTIADVKNIAKAFATQDPDGNGADDTIGLLLDKDFLNQSKGIFWAFGAYVNKPEMWIKNADGKIVYSYVQPEMKNGLAWLNDLYKEGLIDKEFAIKDFDKAFEAVVDGRCGLFYGPHWNAITLENNIKSDPDAEWMVVLPPTESGEISKIPLTCSVDYAVVANKDMKNPEAVVKMFNLYGNLLFYGPNAEKDFSKYYAENGMEIWQYGPVFFMPSDIDLACHQAIKKAVKENTTDKLTGAPAIYYSFMEGDNYWWPYPMMFGPENSYFTIVDETYPDKVIWNEFFQAPTQTMGEKWSTLEELLQIDYTKIITGQLSVDGFENTINNWNNMGGAQITEEVNEAVKNNK